MASVATRKIDTLRGETVNVRRAHVGKSLGFAISLSVGSDRTPAHVVDIKVKNIGTRCDFRTLGHRGAQDRSQQEDEIEVFHCVLANDPISSGAFNSLKEIRRIVLSTDMWSYWAFMALEPYN